MTLALAMASSRWLSEALSPLAVVSQAIPFMALAPLLMIWFGFGIASKIAMAAITIFSPWPRPSTRACGGRMRT